MGDPMGCMDFRDWLSKGHNCSLDGVAINLVIVECVPI